MPWTPESFRRRHNKRLTPAKAAQAAGIANAMLRRGVKEGVAIATANARASEKTHDEKRAAGMAAIRKRRKSSGDPYA